MGRWTQYDEDDYRLPEGMKRVGYDADTQKYQFRDRDGSVWESAEGSQYGELTMVSHGQAPTDLTSDNEDLEAAPTGTDGYQPLAVDADAPSPRYAVHNNTVAYRTIFPFFLIIAVVLLLVIRLASHHSHPGEMVLCENGGRPYRVNSGDTCWELSQKEGFSLDDLKTLNPGLECKLLTPTQIICLPDAKPKLTARRV